MVCAAYRRSLQLAAWGSLAAVAYVTLSPIEARPVVAAPSYEHVFAFLGLTALFCFAYPQRMLVAAGGVLFSAIVLEALQSFVPSRHGRLADFFEKGLGILLGVGIVYLCCLVLGRRVRRRRGQSDIGPKARISCR